MRRCRVEGRGGGAAGGSARSGARAVPSPGGCGAAPTRVAGRRTSPVTAASPASMATGGGGFDPAAWVTSGNRRVPMSSRKYAGIQRGDVMKYAEDGHTRGLSMPRSRGAVSGLLLVILGAWGALIPFVGPHFNFAYTPDRDWAWSSARGWLEVAPGAATALGGLLLIVAGNRVAAMLGGWLAVLAGAWFVVGGQLAPLLGIGSAGDPIAATERKRALLEVTYFSGLGALIIFVGGVVLARTSARLARDVQPLASDAPAAPAVEPYRDPAYDPADVSSGALTKPRTSADPEPKRGWRKNRAGGNAAYLRWPHPQQ
ncbi:hypothetical protein MAP44135_2917 [Mycobacterium avium subsp. paratuberculosis]|uniref:Uncharacterized protein n=3 Tax=Mycobacterium avium TaxID=1764 RepID=Q741Q0_MYCPA|nr:hypothetical protein MAP_1039 [Mycobacterium avium subsp. paratuberculosis K-10]AGL37697.1 hypothetical protein MAP4_2817 [Mycobacterium avium subsp. paratuberculosis MAP4]QKU46264.1 hypothetical protein MAP44135_2917 [Mycobacterium avium subsp. paratuberculosis]